MTNNDFAILGCPACQKYIHNGKQKYNCKLMFNACQQVKKCKLRTRVVSVLDYLQNSSDLDEVKETVKDIVKFLKEGDKR